MNKKKIKGFENYYIYEDGSIFSLKSKKFLKPKTQSCGYLQVDLCKNAKIKTFYIHRLVALSFIENKECKKCINHKDKNKTNNNVNNLEWVTYTENMIHASGKSVAKIENGNIVAIYKSINSAARKNNISVSNISNCCNKKRKSSGGYGWIFIKKTNEN